MTMSVPDDLASRHQDPSSRSDIVELAADALKDLGVLLHTELELFRAEIAEKLAFTAWSIVFIGGGVLLLAATIGLVLQAAIAGLVEYGVSLPFSILIVAAASLAAGAGLVWIGFHNLSLNRLTPTKTVRQVRKDAAIAKVR
jgi:hypothetical protein